MTSFAWPASRTPTDVWLCIGDSECSGRGNISGAVGGYEPATKLQMIKTIAAGIVTLDEPCGDGGGDSSGVGPCGLFGWLASLDTGRNTCIINAGKGSATTALWLSGQAHYLDAINRAKFVLSRRSHTFRGFIVYIGLNDAATVTPTVWRTNTTSTIAALRTAIGSAATGKPVAVVQLPPTVPTDTTYNEHANVRADIVTYDADSADNLLIAAEDGPWVEGAKIHLTTPANYVIAQRILTAFKAHSSWA